MMGKDLSEQLLEALNELPLIDAHTHLVGGRLTARGLHDVLLYHMSISELYAAGCPSGTRLTEFPGWPSVEEAHRRLEEAIPFLLHTRNTSIVWGIRIILRDLYDWDEPVTSENWRRLDDRIRERADDGAWGREIAKRVKIQHAVTELARRGKGADDDFLRYSLEWAFFTRSQWGEYDTALYELEKCWGEQPSSPTPIGAGKRPATKRQIRSIDDVHAAVDYYVRTIPYDKILSMATHISTDLNLRLVLRDEMAAALERREQAGPEERSVYASYVNEAFLCAMERHPAQTVFQFSYAAEPLPVGTASRVTQENIAQLADMIGRHPALTFHCYLSSQHANQSLCTLSRGLPNLVMVGFWWHNFFPSVIRRVIEERLEMLPLIRQIGFFSDAYCLEWSYAKSQIILRQYAEVMAGKIHQGQYDFNEALSIAQAVLYDSPRELLKMNTAKQD